MKVFQTMSISGVTPKVSNGWMGGGLGSGRWKLGDEGGSAAYTFLVSFIIPPYAVFFTLQTSLKIQSLAQT
jgi:hypothetical protein